MNYTAAELLEFAATRETWALEARQNGLRDMPKEWELTAAIARQCARCIDDRSQDQQRLFHYEGAFEPLRAALALVLMFYTVGEWSDEKKTEWKRITGNDDASTKAMCDHIRQVLGER
jgi:hypothetical protein